MNILRTVLGSVTSATCHFVAVAAGLGLVSLALA